MRRGGAGWLILVAGLVGGVTSLAGAAVDGARIGDARQIHDLGATEQTQITARCSGNKRAVGGGAVPVGSDVGAALLTSAPTRAGGDPMGAASGDPPKGWIARVRTQVFAPEKDFRVYAICAKAKASMRVKALRVPGGSTRTTSVGCPRGTRALGGGAFTRSDSGFAETMGPTGSDGAFASVSNRDVPKRWRATLAEEDSGATARWKIFAVCARASDAQLKVSQVDVPATQSVSGAIACGTGRRATGGGIFTESQGSGNVFMTASGPVAAGGLPGDAAEGDVPRGWYTGVNNFAIGGAAIEAKGVAVCE